MQKNEVLEERIIRFESIDSTHKYIKENHEFLKNGTIIIANNQTAGIGAKDHKWHTGNGNIAMSILYKPTCKISELAGLTIEVAKAMQEVIKNLYDVALEIKEPNDLFLNGKKIGGILTEANTIGEKINFLIISLGFNVSEVDFPKELREIATSLKLELNQYSERNIEKEEIILEFMKVLEMRMKNNIIF